MALKCVSCFLVTAMQHRDECYCVLQIQYTDRDANCVVRLSICISATGTPR